MLTRAFSVCSVVVVDVADVAVSQPAVLQLPVVRLVKQPAVLHLAVVRLVKQPAVLQLAVDLPVVAADAAKRLAVLQQHLAVVTACVEADVVVVAKVAAASESVDSSSQNCVCLSSNCLSCVFANAAKTAVAADAASLAAVHLLPVVADAAKLAAVLHLAVVVLARQAAVLHLVVDLPVVVHARQAAVLLLAVLPHVAAATS